MARRGGLAKNVPTGAPSRQWVCEEVNTAVEQSHINDLEALLLGESSEEAIKAAFEKLDCDGDGYFEREELEEICKKFQTLGFGSDPAALDKLMERLDVDGDGQIDYEEFIAACKLSGGKDAKRKVLARGASASPTPVPADAPEPQKDSADMISSKIADKVSDNLIKDIGAFLHTSADIEVLRMAFQKLDKDNSGSLSHDELADVIKRFRKFGFKATDKEINALMNHLDVDNDGTIDFAEFVAMVGPKKPQPPPQPRRSNARSAANRHLDYSAQTNGGQYSYRDKFREECHCDKETGTPRTNKWMPSHWTR